MLDCSYLLFTLRRQYGRSDCLLLYNTLLSSDWSCLCNENSFYSAFRNIIATVSEATNQAIPFVKYRNSSSSIDTPALLNTILRR